MELYAWFLSNAASVGAVLLAAVALGEAVTKLTPTKEDDGFVTRIGQKIDWLLKLLRVPNNVKKND